MRKNLLFTCPFCGQDLIFTGKREKTVTCFGDAGASFYACGCGKTIVSEAFFNKDGTPMIFRDNMWSHYTDGSWWYLRKEKGKLDCWENMSLRTFRQPAKPIPQVLEVKVLIT